MPTRATAPPGLLQYGAPAGRLLPALPFEIQEYIIREASAVNSSPYQGDDVAHLLARQAFVVRACLVSSGWRSVAQPLLYGRLYLDVHTVNPYNPCASVARSRRVLYEPEIAYSPRLLWCLRSIISAKERLYTPSSVMPVSLYFTNTHWPTVDPTREPSRSSADALPVSSFVNKTSLRHAVGHRPVNAHRYSALFADDVLSDQNFPPAGSKISIKSLTLESSSHLDLLELMRIVELYRTRDVEQISLCGEVGLDMALEALLKPPERYDPEDYPWDDRQRGGLSRLTDFRVQLGQLVPDAMESVERVLDRSGPQLHVFHLLPADDSWIPRHLLDKLSNLETLALNTHSCAFLFDQGRLPCLKYLYLGHPAAPHSQSADERWSKTDQSSFVKLVDDIVKEVPASKVGLHIGFWQLSFQDGHSKWSIVRQAYETLCARGLIMTDRWGKAFDADWLKEATLDEGIKDGPTKKRTAVELPRRRRPSTFGKGWIERRRRSKGKGRVKETDRSGKRRSGLSR